MQDENQHLRRNILKEILIGYLINFFNYFNYNNSKKLFSI